MRDVQLQRIGVEILREGSFAARAEAARTLDKVKHAMRIDYFA